MDLNQRAIFCFVFMQERVAYRECAGMGITNRKVCNAFSSYKNTLLQQYRKKEVQPWF